MAATPTLPPETAVPPGGPPAVAGSPLDRYALGEEIARGGMGVVLAARDTQFGRDVAVKVLRPEYRGRPAAERRFLDEARVTGQLQHPGVPPAYDIGTLPDGSPFLALKLVKGRTLADLLIADPAGRPRLVAVVEQVAQTLAFAHAKGVIHRDLKPGNVMVGAFGEVQVMDWGLAKVLTPVSREAESSEPSADPHRTELYTHPSALDLPDSDDRTQAGSMLGTPAYMPPEQAAGQLDRIDRRSDVFALGAVLCELLTGKPPYAGDTSEKTKALAVLGQLQPAYDRLAGCGADAELVELARRCLSADPADRPADARAVADALTAHREGVEAKLRAAEVSAAEQRVRRRLRTRLAAAVMLALAAGGLAAGWQWRRADAALARVREQDAEVREALGRETAERERVAAALAGERAARERIRDGLTGWMGRLAQGDADTLDYRAEYAAIERLWQDAAGEAPEQATGRRRFELAAYRSAIFGQIGDSARATAEFRVAMQQWPTLRPAASAPSPGELREYAKLLGLFINTLESADLDPPITRVVNLPPPDDHDEPSRYASDLPDDSDERAAAAGSMVAAVGYVRPHPDRAGLAQAATAGPTAVAAVVGLTDAELMTGTRPLALERLAVRRQLAAVTDTTADRRDLASALCWLAMRGELRGLYGWCEPWAGQELAERTAVVGRPDATDADWYYLVDCRERQASAASRRSGPVEALFALAAARQVLARWSERLDGHYRQSAINDIAKQAVRTHLARRDHRRAAAAVTEYLKPYSDAYNLKNAAASLTKCYTLADADTRPAYLGRTVELLERAVERDRDYLRIVRLHHDFDAVRDTPEFQQLLAKYAPKPPAK